MLDRWSRCSDSRPAAGGLQWLLVTNTTDSCSSGAFGAKQVLACLDVDNGMRQANTLIYGIRKRVKVNLAFCTLSLSELSVAAEVRVLGRLVWSRLPVSAPPAPNQNSISRGKCSKQHYRAMAVIMHNMLAKPTFSAWSDACPFSGDHFYE